jgi:hypothetical protein
MLGDHGLYFIEYLCGCLCREASVVFIREIRIEQVSGMLLYKLILMRNHASRLLNGLYRHVDGTIWGAFGISDDERFLRGKSRQVSHCEGEEGEN